MTAACQRCGATPTRLYAQGQRCQNCSPAALAGRPEPPHNLPCAPRRHYCPPGHRCPAWAAQQPLWRVLATGGRDRDDKPAIWAVFDAILVEHPRLVVVHGAAYPKPTRGVRPDRSADWLVHLWCVEHDIYEETHPADWNTCATPECTPEHRKTRRDGTTYCPLAGLHRNGQMVARDADECVAFPGAGNGTRHCISQASEECIPVRIVWPHAPTAVAP